MARDYRLILEGVLSAAASAMNAADRTPGRVELIPGLRPAWDDCCKGQLYLRVVEIYPTAGGQTAPFPQFDAAQRGAGAGGGCKIHGLALRIGLGIIRCVHTVSNNGKSPKPEDVSEDAAGMLEDMAILLDVLACTVPSLYGVLAMKLDRWSPQGAEGGCAGGEWGAYLWVDPCLCQPLPEE